MMDFQNEFELVVTPKRKWYELKLKEVNKYRDLIMLFVKRSFTSQYKQTILGPAWFIINPILTSFISTIVFGNIAKIESDGIPYFLFYLAGYCLWNYFSTCVTTTSSTFISNSGIMGKVYFPRLTMPIASVLYAGINMFIVFMLTIIVACVYLIQGYGIHCSKMVILIPILMIQTAALGLGVGIIVSSLTTKYRDLNVLVGFGLNLWMYVTPIVYPMTMLSGKWKLLMVFNPMASIIQNFKYCLLGIGEFEAIYWFISIVITFICDLVGILLFNKVERTFMDTI